MSAIAFDPLDFLKTELSSEEVYVKINAMHRLKVISTILGSSRVEEELIPYLSQLIPTLEDETLYALSQELGSLHIYMNENHIKLLPLLEQLSSAEETLVRDQAVQSLTELANYLPDYQLIHSFIASVLKLASSELFTARISACRLFIAAYPRAGSFRERLRNKLIDLCQDENYLIRKAAAEQINQLTSVVERSSIQTEIFPMIKILSQDEQEEIRSICIKLCRKLCQILSKEDIKALVLPLINEFQEDFSWIVRRNIAQEIGGLAEVCEVQVIETGLLPSVLKLLKDSENEVKCAMLAGLGILVEKLGEETVTGVLFPQVLLYFEDDDVQIKVKIYCLRALVKIWQCSPQEFCVTSVFPVIQSAVHGVSREIYADIIKNLHVFASAGEDFVHKNLRKILEDAMDLKRNWRVRRKALKSITKIVALLGDEVFVSSLQTIFLKFITDPIAKIREIGCLELKKISKSIGVDYFSGTFYPILLEIYQNATWYLIKICVIHVLGCIPGDYLSIFSMASKDGVANVKIAVCKVINQMAAEGKEISAYKSFLFELKKDKDRDVVDFASSINVES